MCMCGVWQPRLGTPGLRRLTVCSEPSIKVVQLTAGPSQDVLNSSIPKGAMGHHFPQIIIGLKIMCFFENHHVHRDFANSY